MTLRVVIIEDEEEAADRLERMIKKAEPDTEVLAKLDSIQKSLAWMKKHPAPDLYFMDIHLADGHSFEIFKQTEVRIPVIFTTAYDKYAIEAFKVNSIHYLLKPVKAAELEEALQRYRSQSQGKDGQQDIEKLVKLLHKGEKEYIKRIMIRYGSHLKVFDVDNAAYFYSKDKINYLCTFDNQQLPVDQSLDELEKMLDPEKFFRLNRQFIISFPAIDQMITYPKSRVKVTLKPHSELESFVSSERSAEFKKWLVGNE